MSQIDKYKKLWLNNKASKPLSKAARKLKAERRKQAAKDATIRDRNEYGSAWYRYDQGPRI